MRNALAFMALMATADAPDRGHALREPPSQHRTVYSGGDGDNLSTSTSKDGRLSPDFDELSVASADGSFRKLFSARAASVSSYNASGSPWSLGDADNGDDHVQGGDTDKGLHDGDEGGLASLSPLPSRSSSPSSYATCRVLDDAACRWVRVTQQHPSGSDDDAGLEKLTVLISQVPRRSSRYHVEPWLNLSTRLIEGTVGLPPERRSVAATRAMETLLDNLLDAERSLSAPPTNPVTKKPYFKHNRLQPNIWEPDEELEEARSSKRDFLSRKFASLQKYKDDIMQCAYKRHTKGEDAAE